MRGFRSAEPKTMPDRVVASDSSKQQEVFKDWLAKYLRRLDRVSGEESASTEPRPAGRETAGSIKNVVQKQA